MTGLQALRIVSPAKWFAAERGKAAVEALARDAGDAGIRQVSGPRVLCVQA
jgi:hypothetical protein